MSYRLPKYGSTTQCPKCLGDVIGTEWRRSRRTDEYQYQYEDRRTPLEHLARICRRCGYTWAEDLAEQERTP